jgi:MFS family permease
LVARTGAVMIGVTMGFQAYEQTRSALIVGLVAAAFGVPFALSSLAAGVAEERLGLPVMMGGALVLRVTGIVVLAIVAGTPGDDVSWLVVVSINSGLGGALLFVGTQLLIHELEPPEHLRRAVLVSAVVLSLAAVVGPLVAGILIQELGLAPVYLLAATCFVPSGVVFVVLARRVRPQHPAQPARLREAVRLVRQVPLLRWAIVSALLGGALADPLMHLMPVVVKTFNRDAADQLGLLVACIALGSLGQVILLGRLGSRYDPRIVVTAAYAAAGALLVGLALDNELFVAPFLLISFGLAAGIGKALLLPTVHLATPHSHRHHVLALYTFVTAVVTPIAALLWGACAQVVGITATTAGAGIALIALTSLTALLRADTAAARRVRAHFAAPGPATS